jgi:KDO2-lipid IV(A) lauroyltransferase
MLFFEVLFTTRLVRIETWADYVEIRKFSGDVLALFLKKNQGLIMLTGHYGNWEILGYVLATLGFDTTSIARPLDNPYVNDLACSRARKRGQRIIAKKGATGRVPDVLARGGAVVLSSPIRTPDRKASSSISSAARRARTNRSRCWRWNTTCRSSSATRGGMNDRFHFRVGTTDLIRPEDWKDQDNPMLYITQRFHDRDRKIRERKIRGNNLWVHRRWKDAAEGGSAGEVRLGETEDGRVSSARPVFQSYFCATSDHGRLGSISSAIASLDRYGVANSTR